MPARAVVMEPFLSEPLFPFYVYKPGIIIYKNSLENEKRNWRRTMNMTD
jgi:hypothetical protein